MIYFIFLIYTLITTGQSALNKIYRKSIDDDTMKDCITFLGTLVVETVFYSILSGFDLRVNGVTAFYAFMFALAVAINTLVSMRALENSELVIYSLFSNAGGTIWTAILGLILFNESITISRALGLVLIMATIIIPFVTAKKSKTGGKGIFWCSMMFFTASLPTLVLKFYSQAEGVLGDSILCFYTNVFTIPFILYLLKKKGTVAGTVKAMVTKYKKPVMITDAPIELRARVVEQKRNVLDIAVELRDAQGELCTTANCIYFLFPKDRAKEEFGFMEFKTEDEL